MKKYFLILLAVMVFIFTSCEDENSVTFNEGDGFVQLNTSSSVEVTENSGNSITTTIELGVGSNTNGIDVSFSVTASDASRFMITPSNGSISIPAGQTTAEIVITPIDNFNTDGNVDITIELTGGSLPVGIGGEGLELFSRRITIIDDDCPFDINDFVGSYAVDITSTNRFRLPAGLFQSTTTLELGTEPNTLVDTNFWDDGERVVITFDPSDPANPTVELVGDPQFVYFNGAGLPRFAIQATNNPLGSFSTCTSGFQVNMSLTREDMATVANNSVMVYTRQ